jgi:hypothetical protein
MDVTGEEGVVAGGGSTASPPHEESASVVASAIPTTCLRMSFDAIGAAARDREPAGTMRPWTSPRSAFGIRR